MASASTSKEYKLAIKIAGAVSSSFDSAIGEAGQKIANLGSIAQAAAATVAAAWGALKLGEFISDAVDTYQGFEQAMANTSAIAGATGERPSPMASMVSAASGSAAIRLSNSRITHLLFLSHQRVIGALRLTGECACSLYSGRHGTGFFPICQGEEGGIPPLGQREKRPAGHRSPGAGMVRQTHP